MDRPPLPPFTDETASEKARLAEDAWNSRDPAKVSVAPNSPSDRANASTAPEIRPGASSGSDTFHHTVDGRAPRVAATTS